MKIDEEHAKAGGNDSYVNEGSRGWHGIHGASSPRATTRLVFQGDNFIRPIHSARFH